MSENSFSERVVPDNVPYNFWQEHINRYIFALNYVSNRVVLDVACGTGYGTELISKTAYLAIGLDVSRIALTYASKHCRKNSHIDFVLADANHLPFRSGTFEIVVSFETIEHLIHPQDFLQQIKSVLEINGQLIISTPNGKISSPNRNKPTNPFHFREFDRQEFSNLMSIFSQRPQFYSQRPTFLALFPLIDRHIHYSLRMLYRKIAKSASSRSPMQQLDATKLDPSYRVKKTLELYPFYCPYYFIVIVKNEKC